MPDTELASLRRKRRRICANLTKLEPMVADYHAKLATVEAAILAIDPQLWLPPRRYKPNPAFARQELPRLVMGILRGLGFLIRHAEDRPQGEGAGAGAGGKEEVLGHGGSFRLERDVFDTLATVLSTGKATYMIPKDRERRQWDSRSQRKSYGIDCPPLSRRN
jgi:hypothetical protein